MKRVFAIILVGIMVLAISGCGLSQGDYDAVVAENEELKKEIQELMTKNEELSADKAQLQTALAETYDAYRGMLLYVTTEVYGNSLAQKEWEQYIADNKYPVPTFDEVKAMVNN